MKSGVASPPVDTAPAKARGLRGIEWMAGTLLLVLLAATILHLWPQWLRNPDLSHGLFTPVVVIILLHEARTRGTPRFLAPTPALTALIGVVGLVGILLLVGAGLYAAALEWTHALVEFVLAGALCALLTAAWLTAALDGVRRLPFNWPAAVSILAWALSAPIPPGTYTRLTQQLQSAVTDAVLVSLHLLGIAAFRDGNVIDLAHVSVGVEEACSGVRSLISCIFAGFFLSSVLCRKTWQRVVIIGLSAPLAIAMNFVRSLTLTLLAHSGVEIRGFWHDLTGFSILVVTAAVLAGLALLIARLDSSSSSFRSSVSNPALQRSRTRSTVGAECLLLGVLLLSFSTLLLFVANTRPSRRPSSPPPSIQSLLPSQASGWQVTTRTDLYRFSSQLQTDFLTERTYTRTDENGLFQITVYVAYWPAGQASVSLVSSHTPDACWPGSGWVEDLAGHRALSLEIGPHRLPEAESRTFHLDHYPQHVWYWHLFDGKPIHQKIGSARDLLSSAWHYGFRKEEEQVFIRISSNRPWEEIAQQPLLSEIVTQFHPLGL